MKYPGKQSLRGYGIVLIGALMAPLLPFAVLAVFPIAVVLSGAPVAGLLFAILIDSFLFSGTPMPMYISSVFYTAFSFPLYVYLRYTAP